MQPRQTTPVVQQPRQIPRQEEERTDSALPLVDPRKPRPATSKCLDDGKAPGSSVCPICKSATPSTRIEGTIPVLRETGTNNQGRRGKCGFQDEWGCRGEARFRCEECISQLFCEHCWSVAHARGRPRRHRQLSLEEAASPKGDQERMGGLRKRLADACATLDDMGKGLQAGGEAVADAIEALKMTARAIEPPKRGQAQLPPGGAMPSSLAGPPVFCPAQPAQFGDVDLGALVGNNPPLTAVDLRGCKMLTNGAIEALAQKCRSLTSLNLTNCDQLTDGAIITLAKHCPALTALEFHGCHQLTDEAILALAQHCRSLTVLNASLCRKLTDKAVITLAQHCPSLSKLYVWQCVELSDKAIVAVVTAQECPLLTALWVSQCDKLTDLAIITLAWNCPSLTCLHVSACMHLTDEALFALSRHCQLLEDLRIKNCNWTDEAIIAVAQRCPALAIFDVSWCNNLTDKAIIAVARHCPSLTSLWVAGCTKLTDLSIIALQQCRDLKNLDVSGCHEMTDEVINNLKERRPLLQVQGR